VKTRRQSYQYGHAAPPHRHTASLR